MSQVYRAIIVVCLLASSAPSVGQTVETIAEDERYQPLTPPETVEGIDALLATVRERMERVAPDTQPAAAVTQPEQLPARTRAALALYEVQRAYLDALERLKTDKQVAAELGSDATLQKLRDQTTQYEDETARLKADMDTPPDDAEQLAKRLKEQYTQHNALLEAVSAKQTERVAELAQLPEMRNKLSAAATELTQKLEKFRETEQKRLAEATSDDDRQAIDYERAALRAKLSLNRLQQAATVARQTRLTLERTQQERLLAALKDYVVTLGQRVNTLEGRLTESELERVEYRLRRAKRPYEITYLQARKLLLEASAFVTGFDEQTRVRYSADEHNENVSDWSANQRTWKAFLDSVPRRTGPSIRQAYRVVLTELRQARATLADLQARYDLTLAQYQQVLDKRDEVDVAIQDLREELRTNIAALTNEEQKKQAEEYQLELVGQDEQAFDSLVSKVLREQEATGDRLTAATDNVEEVIATLEGVRSALRWAYVTARDIGLAVAPWSTMRAEVEALAAGRGKDAGKLKQSATALTNQVRAAGWARWLAALALLIVAAVLGGVARRAMRRWHDRGCEAIREHTVEGGREDVLLPDRLRLQGVGYVAWVLPWVAVLAALAAAVRLIGLEDVSRRLAFMLIASLALAVLAFGAVSVLFQTARPRFRVIPCSNVVATYYRRGLRWVLIVAAGTSVVPFVASQLDVAPVLTSYLWLIQKAAFLIALLVFLWPQQTVRRVAGRDALTSRGFLPVLVRVTYPWVWLALLALLAGCVVGYGALAGHVLRGLGLTFGILLLGGVLSRLVRDLEVGYRRRVEARLEMAKAAGQQEGAGASPGDSGGGPDAPASPDGGGGGQVIVAASATVLRWVIVVAAIVAVLAAWGVSVVDVRSFWNLALWNRGTEKVVTIGRVIGAVLAVVIAVTIWRGFRGFLETRVYPQYPVLDRGSRGAINRLSQYVAVLIGFIVGMQMLRIDLTALSWLFGMLGIGLGLGLQPLFVNFVSGLMILFERHIRVGDTIQLEETMGEVSKISIRSTTIRSFDNVELVVPNGEFINSKVMNWTLESSVVRGLINVGVAYGSDLQLVRKLLLEVAAESPRALKRPEPSVWFTDFGASSLDFVLVAWFSSPADRWFGMIDMRYEIDKKFREHGITIPFPQRTLSLIDDKPLAVQVVSAPDGRAAAPRPSSSNGNTAGESR